MNGERESGDEDQSQVLPTLTEINTTVSSATKAEETKTAAPVKPKKKEPQFEEESKVHEEDPPSADEVSSTSTKEN